MTDSKIAIILDKSPGYISFQVDRILQEWKAVEVLRTSDLDKVGGGSLFGAAPTTVLTLESIAEVKKFVTEAERAPGRIADLMDSGLVLVTSVARNSTKKIEKLVTDLGGIIYAPPAKGQLSIQEKLLSELNLSPDVRRWALDYVGDSYESLLSLVRTIGSIDWEYQRRITEEDLYIRMTQKKGAVPPWEIEGPILAGNLEKAVDMARRIHADKSLLVWLITIKNKFVVYHRVAAALESGAKEAAVKEALGLKGGGAYYTVKTAKSRKASAWQAAVVEIISAEDKIKGGSAAPSEPLSEALLERLCSILSRGSGRN